MSTDHVLGSRLSTFCSRSDLNFQKLRSHGNLKTWKLRLSDAQSYAYGHVLHQWGCRCLADLLLCNKPTKHSGLKTIRYDFSRFCGLAGFSRMVLSWSLLHVAYGCREMAAGLGVQDGFHTSGLSEGVAGTLGDDPGLSLCVYVASPHC